MWNEAQNDTDAVNFITGMGGFLQAILFGYAGIRLHLDYLRASPILPPGITNMTIQGMLPVNTNDAAEPSIISP